MEKLDQIFIATVSALGAMGGFIIKKLHTRVDNLEDKVEQIGKKIVDREYLETQLAPIRSDLNLILSHLLKHRQTEGKQEASQTLAQTESNLND
jgi:hypothetical protein